ncbi:MAG: N-acetylglutaminylglutamine amidotransferase [Rhodospirillaceae bacterium]
MCGIAGEITFDGSTASAAVVDKMADVLQKRGPDGQGLWAQGRVAFGHRRLKIIDLSENAQQPMVDPDLGLTIVFNGCIYNYRALRKTLQDKGYRFFAHSDTEVILKAFHFWGADCVDHFHGMFAFAIYDRETGRTTFARDRLGIKPFYYAEVAGGLRFASTLPALVAGGGIDTSIDPVGLNHYMNFHAVVPPPRTLLNGIKKLPPAHIMTVKADGTRALKRYWQVDYSRGDAETNMDETAWTDQVLESLRVSVKRRLEADVPVGVLLSGGVDSSLIVGLLAEQGAKDLNTFSVGFETVGEEAGDEFKYSDIIAERFDTTHHKIFVDSAKRLLPELPACIAAMSEPMVSHDSIGFFLLSEEVSRHVKVVQSGQGADEVFGGYHWYPPMVHSQSPTDDYARVFCDRSHAEYRETVTPRFYGDGDDHARAFIAERFAEPGATSGIAKALRMDTHVMLVDDPVKRVDTMTMAWGLEARVPFLDHEVVELAARIPPALHIKHDGKHLLKEAARRVIPASVIDRPKGYFPVPALKYLRGSVLDMVREVVTDKTFTQRNIVQCGYIDRLLENPDDHITPLRGSKLWQVALLGLWLNAHDL